MLEKIKIGNKLIGNNQKTFIIAEVGQAHEGKISKVFKYIDAISKTGVDAIKFQTHIAEEESTLDEPFRKNFNFKIKNRFDYWKSVEFSLDQWKSIKRYSEKKGLIFLTSVFSIKAAKMMKKIGIKAVKLGSGEFNSFDLMDEIIKLRLPILLSTGVATYKEINNVYSYLKKRRVKFGLFQCTSNYPLKLEKVGINLIEEFKRKYKCPIGLSDHTGTIFPSIYSIARNTDILEVHVVISKYEKGPDVASSVDIQELKNICEINNAIHIMKKNPMNKFKISKDLKKLKKIFGKSIALKKDINKGDIIKKENILMKKPAIGFSINQINQVVGRTARKYISSKRIIRKSDLTSSSKINVRK